MNTTGYPVAETTGTASFTYAMAWGLNNDMLLPAPQYRTAVAKAWGWLTSVALHTDGRVGNCQPGGAAPANNFDANSTSDFCVGQFLLAAAEVSRLEPPLSSASLLSAYQTA